MATFHPFPRLSAELRLRIWEMTVEPRLVDIHYSYRLTPDRNRIDFLCSSTPIPAPLQTCREARNARLYQRFRSSEAQRYVWVNFDIDMVFLDVGQLHRFKTNGHLIKRLRFVGDYSEWWSNMGGHDGLRNFPNVTEIQVVLSEESDFEHWHGASRDYWPCDEKDILFVDPEDGKEMTLLDLESKFDRIWTQIERERGTNLVYHKGDVTNWSEVDFNIDDVDDRCYYASDYT